MSFLEKLELELWKDTHGEEKINAEFIRKLLDEQNLEIDFTVGELLRIWKSKKWYK